MPTQYEAVTSFSYYATLLVHQLAPGLHVFRRAFGRRHHVVTNGTWHPNPNNFSTHDSEGVVDEANLQRLLEGVDFNPLELRALPDAMLEAARCRGWTGLEEFAGSEWFSMGPYSATVERGLSADNLVRLDYSGQQLFDREGQPLPMGIFFGYNSSGSVDESRYDMERLVAHLLTRKDVALYGWKDSHRRYELDKEKRPLATSPENAIFLIPYYNATPGHTRTAYFHWMPSREDYRRMWAACGGRAHRIYETIFDLDLLGLRAAGAVRSTLSARRPE